MKPFRSLPLVTVSALAILCSPFAAADLLNTGKVRVWSYAQVRLVAPENKGNSLSLARSKIMVKGKPNPDLDYYFQVIYKNGNHSKTDGDPYVQELWARFALGNGKLKVGQFKPPMGLERFTWDGALDLVLRTQATDRLIPNGKLGRAYVRDYGVQWESTAFARRLKYFLSVQGGNGANARPHGIAPLLGARGIWTFRNGKTATNGPDRFTFGAAVSTRRARDLNFASALSGTKGLGYDHFSGHDVRWNLECARDLGPWRWRSEYFHARFSSDRAAVPTLSADGWYVQGAYQPNARWSAALRYEAFDPNSKALDKNDLRWTTVGVTFFRHGNDEKLQVNYIWKHERAQSSNNDALVAQYQRVF